jgi:hypothetical protein
MLDPMAFLLTGLAIPDELGGFQSFLLNDAALNDSGSLLFVPLGAQLFIFDTKHGDLLRSVTLANRVNVAAKVIAVDSSGEPVLLVIPRG